MRLNNSHVLNELYQFNYKDINMSAVDLDLTEFINGLESWSGMYYYDGYLYILDAYTTGINYKVNLETKETIQLSYTFNSDIIENGYYDMLGFCGNHVLIIETLDYESYYAHILTLGEDIIDTPINIISDKGYDINDLYPDNMVTDADNKDIIYCSTLMYDDDNNKIFNDILYKIDVKNGTMESMHMDIEEPLKKISGDFNFAYFSYDRLKVVYNIDKYIIFYEYSEILNKFYEVDRIIGSYDGFNCTHYIDNHMMIDYRLNEFIGVLIYDLHTHEKYLTPRLVNNIRSVSFVSSKLLVDGVTDGNFYYLKKIELSKPDLFSGDYNDLTNKPEIPNIEGLANKEYVDQSIAQANETQTSSITQNIAGTYAEKTYVDNKVEGTKYTHPSAHPASIIITTDDRQFASAQEKEQWNIGYNHSQAAHAPTNAQKNSDITKAEIEAKLTGTITSHSHDVNSEGSKLATESFVQAEIVKSALEGQIDTSVFALKENIPTKVSQLENDMEYLPSLLGTYTKMEQYQIGNQNILPSDMIWQISFLNTEGELSGYTNPNYIVTVNYIPVKESTTYAMFYNGASISAVHYAFYNDNYEFISHSTSSVSLIKTPEDAAYFRTSILVTNPPISITAGSQVIDENGKLVEPSGLFEMYQQANTQYNAGKYFEREVLSRENFYVPFDCLLDGSIRLASCDFTIEYPAINILDPKRIKSGYNSDRTGYGEFGANEAYVCTDPVSVSPGDRLTIWKLSLNKLTAESKNARFISVYNKDYQLIECVSYLHEYIVPDNGKYVMVSLYLSDWDNNKNLMYVQRHESSVYIGYENPLESIYKIDPNCIDNLVIEEVPIHTCLPPEICIPAGMTIELYNAQCCLEADKYHIQWVGQYGAAYDWKYSIVGEEELVGTSFTLTMNVINDALKVLKSEKTTVKIVSNVIDTNQLIIPIGDSLTNQKPWLENIHSVLSNGKVSFRGTRGTTDPTLVNGITHEGRSGAGSGWYNLGTSTYTFDSNGLSTLPDKAANPFWNPTSNAFDFDYYCNSAADGGAGYFQTESGVNTSITPTGVMIFLGANGITLDPSTQVNNIETLINNIRNSIKGAGIPIYVVNTHYRAPYILSTTADGFATNSGGEFKFQNDIKYQNLMRALNNKLSKKTNVSIVPVSVTHDSAHNFPYTEVNVNPYNDKFVERKYTDTIHPMICGYLQMAATMYGSICANYKNQ